MENQVFTAEKLTKLRKGLPNGTQTEIAKRHGVSVQYVNQVLHGQKARSKKCNYLEILSEALEIYNKRNALLEEIADAIEELNK